MRGRRIKGNCTLGFRREATKVLNDVPCSPLPMVTENGGGCCTFGRVRLDRS